MTMTKYPANPGLADELKQALEERGLNGVEEVMLEYEADTTNFELEKAIEGMAVGDNTAHDVRRALDAAMFANAQLKVFRDPDSA